MVVDPTTGRPVSPPVGSLARLRRAGGVLLPPGTQVHLAAVGLCDWAWFGVPLKNAIDPGVRDVARYDAKYVRTYNRADATRQWESAQSLSTDDYVYMAAYLKDVTAWEGVVEDDNVAV